MLRNALARRTRAGKFETALRSRSASTATASGFRPQPVQQLCLDDVTPSTFLSDCLHAANPRPLHLLPRQASAHGKRDLIDRILEEPESERCIVEIEVGRYDRDVEKIQLPLSYYLRWLKEGGEGGQMSGKQVYLAQWRGLEDVRFLSGHCRLRLSISLWCSQTDLSYVPQISCLDYGASSRLRGFCGTS